VDDELKEITELEFRQSCPHLGYLIRIELEEEDIDLLYKQWFRNMKKDAHNNTAKKCPREERGDSVLQKPLVQWKLKDSYAASQLRTLYQGSDNSHNSRQITINKTRWMMN